MNIKFKEPRPMSFGQLLVGSFFMIPNCDKVYLKTDTKYDSVMYNCYFFTSPSNGQAKIQLGQEVIPRDFDLVEV